ncbi:type II toxin-antitoxin system prevent-host-death family antitoxin [Melissospora conviva]|uniref:type II toxin-antitoxin system prevent-host-death family antitoxin n=1 Tax=Melissospora conviva TaxID=3388432 RepID=UPI003C262776
MDRRLINAQQARQTFADLIDRAAGGEHQVINHRSKIGHAVLVDLDFYVRALEALGEAVPEWAATGK